MSKSLIVAKFGGTSVSNFHTMNCSADLIIRKQDTKLVVLSASAGVTNLLIKLAEGPKLKIRMTLLKELKYIQYSIIKYLKNSSIIKIINNIINNIIMLSEIAETQSTKFLTDELVSYGEIMSTLIFVEILREKNVNVEWFDIRQIMITNDNFGNAEPNISLLSSHSITFLKPLINQGKIIITQGFIGRDDQGRTTTFGRGGSDYTATLLGEALNATQIDIWTDVAGIYTTDPNVIFNAKRIDEITFAEAAEMANFGAKILHPATLLPASRSDTPVFVGSSQKPIDGGTLVCNKTQNLPLFRALTLRRNQTLLILHNLSMLHASGFLAKVFNILANHKISVDLITTSEVSIALTLDQTGSTYVNADNHNLVTNELLSELSLLGSIKVEYNLSLVALIGNNLSQACGIGKEVFGVLEKFNLRLICYGASSYNICFLVPGNDAKEVIKILHQNIFE